jgi:hypothetical protein
MGVFTTQTLLSSVGVSRNRATPGAVAINWILKVTIHLSMNISLFFSTFNIQLNNICRTELVVWERCFLLAKEKNLIMISNR